MALTTSIDFNGLPVQEAYIKIGRVFGGKKEDWNSVVGVYVNKQASDEGKSPLEEFNQPADYVTDEIPYSLIYTALKEKYPEAVDC